MQDNGGEDWDDEEIVFQGLIAQPSEGGIVLLQPFNCLGTGPPGPKLVLICT